MAIQTARFRCTGTPNFTALRHEMLGLSGVTEFAMDTPNVTIHWEDTTVTSECIELTLNALGYRKCKSI